ncbi:MAG: MFS transporter [Anaerolineae bacterium]|nr:MFS transporter [Anaerolineae bacterium]
MIYPSFSTDMDRRPVFLFKTFYFLYYAAAASLLPFLVLYYEHLGLSGGQIGVLTAILPLVTLFAASFWGGLADATQQHRPLILLALSGVILLAWVILHLTTFLSLVWVIIAFAFFVAPIVPFLDNSTLAYLGEHKNQYGRLRLWGAVGWGMAAPVVGWLVEQSDLNWSFYSYIGLMFAGLLVAFRLPIRQTRISAPFWQSVRLLLGNNRQWLLFLIVVFGAGVGSAIIHNYLFLYMELLGTGNTLMGLALTVATLSELVIFSSSDRLLNRWGIKNVLLLALAALAVRLLAYAVISNPWLVLPVQLLHGLSFSALWAAGVAYADRIAPPGLGTTAQGLFTGVFMGLAAAVGAFIGGVLYENIGLSWMFGSAGLSLLAVLFIIGMLSQSRFPTELGNEIAT